MVGSMLENAGDEQALASMVAELSLLQRPKQSCNEDGP